MRGCSQVPVRCEFQFQHVMGDPSVARPDHDNLPTIHSHPAKITGPADLDELPDSVLFAFVGASIYMFLLFFSFYFYTSEYERPDLGFIRLLKFPTPPNEIGPNALLVALDILTNWC